MSGARTLHHEHTQLPRRALIAAAALIAFSILAAAIGRVTGAGVTQLPPGQAVQIRLLNFEDRRDIGGVDVYDADTRTLIVHIAPGQDGFVRGVLRGFARARRLGRVGREPPFVLTRWADGRLSLHDPETEHFVALEAFGVNNAAAFARLLAAAATDGVRPLTPLTTQESASGRGADHDHDNS